MTTARPRQPRQHVASLDDVLRRLDALDSKFDKLSDIYVSRREIEAMIASSKPLSDQWRETIASMRAESKDIRDEVRDLAEKFDRFTEQAYERDTRNGRYRLDRAQHANERLAEHSLTINLATVGWVIGIASIVVAILIAAHVI